MTQLWLAGEPITMETGSNGRPLRFCWQGRQHQLQYVVQHWQIDVDWWSEQGRVWRNYLTIITEGSLLCVIYQDLITQEWHLVRVYD